MAKRRKDVGTIKELEDEYRDVNVVEHKHCIICGHPIPMDQEVCSPACKTEYDNMVKKKRMWLYIFYGSVVFFMFILAMQILR